MLILAALSTPAHPRAALLQETNGFCNEDRIECYNFRNATACNGVRDAEGGQACMFTATEYANCEAFNGCTGHTDQGSCTGAAGCSWTDSTTGDSDDSDDNGYCDCELIANPRVPPLGL